MAERDITNRIVWKQDQASAQQVIAQNKSVAASFESVADAAQQLGLNADQVAQLNAQLGGVAQNARIAADAEESIIAATNEQSRVVGELTVRYQEAKIAAEDARRAQLLNPTDRAFASGRSAVLGGNDSSAASTLFNLRQATIALPGVGYQSPLVYGIRGAEAAAAAGAGLPVIGAAALAAAPLIIGAAKAVEALGKDAEIAGRRAKTYSDAFSEALAASTAAQVQELIKRKEIEIQIADATRTELQERAAESQSQLANFLDRTSADLAQRLNAAVGGNYDSTLIPAAQSQEAYNAQVDEQTKIIDDAQIAIEAYNKVLNDNIGLLGDSSAEVDKYLKELTGQFDQEAQLRLQLAGLRRNGTSEQVDEFIRANNDEIAIIQNFLIPAYESAGASTRDLSDRLGDLQHANELAAEAVKPVIEQREREAELLDQLKEKSDAVNDGLKDLADIQKRLGEASAKAAETLQALNEADTENQQRGKEIEDAYSEKVLDARQKLNEKLLDIDARSAERVRQQKENDNLSIEAAIARGDIAAAQQILAQQRVRSEQERRNVQQQKDDAQDAFDAQQKQAVDNRDKALRQEAERYRKEYQQRQQAHNEALAQERALLNAENAQRATNAFTVMYYNGMIAQSYASLGNASQQLASVVTGAASAILNVRQNSASGGSRSPAVTPGGQNAVEAALASFYAQYHGQYVLPQPGAGYINPNLFDTPSYNTRPGIYRSNVPEFHIPMADFNRMNVGGDTLIVNVDATGSSMDERQFRRIVREEVVPIVEKGKVDVVQRMTAVHRSKRR